MEVLTVDEKASDGVYSRWRHNRVYLRWTDDGKQEQQTVGHGTTSGEMVPRMD